MLELLEDLLKGLLHAAHFIIQSDNSVYRLILCYLDVLELVLNIQKLCLEARVWLCWVRLSMSRVKTLNSFRYQTFYYPVGVDSLIE